MKICKRIAALLLAVVLTVSMLGAGILTASAAESYEATNSYVLDYQGTYTGAKWQYFSPYWPAFTYEGTSSYTQSIAFTLYDTLNEEAFPVYCTDLATGLKADSDFRRINLEDSTYAANVAGVLRSIVLKGFPNTGAADLGAAAGVENLTVGEAVAATQAAIWQIAHGEILDFTDFCYYIDTEWSESQNAHFAECNAEIESGYAAAENEELIESNIEAAFNYLINLEPTAPTGIVASQASFIDYDINLTPNSDGTYTVTATATVDVVIDDDTDALTLTVASGDASAATALQNGKNSYALTLTDVPAEAAEAGVTLAIDGTQSAKDVYLFDAVGERGTSQSLIGITDNALPVHAEVTTNDRILNIHKYSPVAGDSWEGKTPLANVVFNIYYVGSLSDYVNGRLGLNSVPTDADVAKYAKDENLVAKVITDENGLASWNFGAVDGVYLVVEQESNTVVTKLADPFFVAVPTVDNLGSYDYIVDVYPKNDVVSEDVLVDKDVTEIGNDSSSCDVNEEHTWIIQSTIPAGIASGIKYEITDTLDYRLTYKGNIKVTVAEDDALAHTETEDYILTEGTHYTVTTAASEDETYGTIYSFKVALTAAGMQKVADLAASDFNAWEIRVYFDAVIDEDGQMGVTIPNQAHVDYTNAVGQDFDADSDTPEVHTGGLNVIKKSESAEGEVLAGAEFKLYEIATEESHTAVLTVSGEQVYVNEVAFYDSADFSGEKVTAVVTDEEGKAYLYGLAYGDYYLVETKAPAGYNKLTEPTPVTVTATSHDVQAEGSWNIVINQVGVILPSTGGMGTTVFYVLGGMLVLAAVVLLVSKRRMAGIE